MAAVVAALDNNDTEIDVKYATHFIILIVAFASACVVADDGNDPAEPSDEPSNAVVGNDDDRQTDDEDQPSDDDDSDVTDPAADDDPDPVDDNGQPNGETGSVDVAACAGDYGGSFDGDDEGLLLGELDPDGTTRLKFTTSLGEVDAVGFVDADGNFAGSEATTSATGKLDFTDCTMSGDWVTIGFGSGTWEASLLD